MNKKLSDKLASNLKNGTMVNLTAGDRTFLGVRVGEGKETGTVRILTGRKGRPTIVPTEAITDIKRAEVLEVSNDEPLTVVEPVSADVDDPELALASV